MKLSQADQFKLERICAEAHARLDAMNERMYDKGWIERGGLKYRTRPGQPSMFGAGAAKPQSSGPSTLIDSPVPLPRQPSPSNANR